MSTYLEVVSNHTTIVTLGAARVKLSRQELYERASAIIQNARQSTELLMKHDLIKGAPSEDKLLK